MRERWLQWLLGAVILALLGVPTAVLMGDGPGEPDRAYALEQKLRCPVCKSVSIAESPSETAAGMRRIVAEQVAAGQSDREIIAYFTERYGSWVLLDPPVGGQTLLLWLLPAAAAAIGVAIVLARVRRSSRPLAGLPEQQCNSVNAALDHYRRQHSQEDEDDEP